MYKVLFPLLYPLRSSLSLSGINFISTVIKPKKGLETQFIKEILVNTLPLSLENSKIKYSIFKNFQFYLRFFNEPKTSSLRHVQCKQDSNIE